MVAEELSPECIDSKSADGNTIIKARDASLSWDRNEPKISVRGLNFSVQKGQLITVVGRVGNGKSSLLQALLGLDF